MTAGQFTEPLDGLVFLGKPLIQFSQRLAMQARLAVELTTGGSVASLQPYEGWGEKRKHATTVILDDRLGFNLDLDAEGVPIGFELLTPGDDLQIEVPLPPSVLAMALAAFSLMSERMRGEAK